MPHYECTGRDAGGNPVSERREAASADALRDELALRGWSDVEIDAVPAEGSRARTQALSSEELITLGEEIAAMARAGLPLDKALRAVSRDLRRGRLKRVLEQLSDDLRAGTSLEESLRKQEGSVPPVFAALATAGVRSGRLPEVLVALNDYARTVADLRLLLASALLYPLLILFLGVGLLCLGMWLTTAGWKDLFESWDIAIPWSTRVALALGSRPVQFFVAPLVGVILLGAAFWMQSRRDPRSRGLGSRLLQSVPVFGMLLRSVRMASFSELLALLTEHELPLHEVFDLAGRATLDKPLRRACEHVRSDLTGGSTLADALERQSAIPKLFTWLVSVGERRGMLSASFRQIGAIYRRRATVRATLARAILPPLFVVVIGGGVVCFYATVLLGPLYSFLSEFGNLF